MARKVTEDDNLTTATPGPETKYDIASWFDGDTWYLIQGEDYTITTESFKEHLRKLGRRRNIRLSIASVRTKDKVEAITVRAFPTQKDPT